LAFSFISVDMSVKPESKLFNGGSNLFGFKFNFCFWTKFEIVFLYLLKESL